MRTQMSAGRRWRGYSQHYSATCQTSEFTNRWPRNQRDETNGLVWCVKHWSNHGPQKLWALETADVSWRPNARQLATAVQAMAYMCTDNLSWLVRWNEAHAYYFIMCFSQFHEYNWQLLLSSKCEVSAIRMILCLTSLNIDFYRLSILKFMP